MRDLPTHLVVSQHFPGECLKAHLGHLTLVSKAYLLLLSETKAQLEAKISFEHEMTWLVLEQPQRVRVMMPLELRELGETLQLVVNSNLHPTTVLVIGETIFLDIWSTTQPKPNTVVGESAALA